MVRCAECGHKNSPVYHYCGVCGAVLKAAEPKPPATPPPASVPPASLPQTPEVRTKPAFTPPAPAEPVKSDIPVTGMSFLGLSSEPESSGPDYLLQDEGEETSHAGRYIMVLLLLFVGAALAWQWRQHGFPFSQTSATVTPGPAVTQPAPSIPDPAPASEPPVAQPSAPPAADTSQPASPEPVKTEPATPAPAEPKAEVPPEAVPEKPAPEPEKTVATVTPPKKPVKATPVPKTVPPAAPAEPSMSAGEALFIQGQRYLYGSSEAPEDCDKALKSFLAAAGRNHSRAASTLGTMYFTGHCVKRDLPIAYRWFAKALRQDPTNARLEQNLSVVWREMTPQERQVATRTE